MIIKNPVGSIKNLTEKNWLDQLSREDVYKYHDKREVLRDLSN